MNKVYYETGVKTVGARWEKKNMFVTYVEKDAKEMYKIDGRNYLYKFNTDGSKSVWDGNLWK